MFKGYSPLVVIIKLLAIFPVLYIFIVYFMDLKKDARNVNTWVTIKKCAFFSFHNILGNN